MSIRIHHPNHASPLPMLQCAPEPPPFFELEDLIESGFDRSTALAILAARRERTERTIHLSRLPATGTLESIGNIAF